MPKDMEQIHLRVGADPWRPALHSTKMLLELNHYHKPLQGVIKQHRRRYLFWCLDGQVTEWGVWVYVPLRRSEVREFRRRSGPDIDLFAGSLLLSREVTVAVASESDGLLESVLVRVQLEQRNTEAVDQSAEAVAKSGLKKISKLNDDMKDQLAFA